MHDGVYKVALSGLVKAALSVGDVEALRDILNEEPEVLQGEFLPDMEGDKALHYAASLPFIETTSLVLQQSLSDPDLIGSRGRRPLHFAAFSGSCDTVSLLLEARADLNAVAEDGSTALIVACANGHTDAAELLVNSGCDCSVLDSSGMAAIHHAAKNCDLICISVLALSVNTLDSRRDPALYVFSVVHFLFVCEPTNPCWPVKLIYLPF